MSGETPKWPAGPWTYDPRTGSVESASSWAIADVNEPSWSLDILPDLGDYDPDATGRLIASAPLLYETLADMRGHVACDCGHPACRRCQDTKEIDAALAAARGEVSG